MKAYLFDMDGTLVNSLNSISYFANKALKKFGFCEIPTDEYKLMVGDGAYTLVKRMMKRVNADEKMFEAVYNEYNKTYDDNFLYLANPYDGILKMLEEIKSSGCKTAIISNKPHSTAQKISDSLFGDMIDICFGKKENFPVKPDPSSVNEVIRLLDVDKKDCFYIGDTLVDMLTGKNAGVYTIGVTWGFRDISELKRGNPDKIVHSPASVTEMLGKSVPEQC